MATLTDVLAEHLRGLPLLTPAPSIWRTDAVYQQAVATELADALAPVIEAAKAEAWPCDDYRPPVTCYTTPKPKTLICQGCDDAFPNGPDVAAAYRAGREAAKAEAVREALAEVEARTCTCLREYLDSRGWRDSGEHHADCPARIVREVRAARGGES